MKFLTSLIDVPVEGYQFMSDLRLDGGRIVGNFCLDFSSQQYRLFGSLRIMSRYRNVLDQYFKLDFSKCVKSPRFPSFDVFDKYIRDNLVFIPEQMRIYYNLARFGYDKQVSPYLFSHPERFEAIRVWINGVKRKDLYRRQNSLDLLTKIEGVYQTIRGFVTTCFKRVPDRICRFLRNKLPYLLFESPDSMISECKSFANYCEKRFFDKEGELSGSFRVFLPYLSERVCA